MAENKTQANEADVAAFLNSVADPQRREDAIALVPMMERLAGERARMWGSSIVGFGRYHYRYDSGREGDAPRIAFSPRAAALTLYLMGDFPEREALMARLGKHKTGKGCLYIKRLSDVDQPVLEQLIAASLAYTQATYPEV